MSMVETNNVKCLVIVSSGSDATKGENCYAHCGHDSVGGRLKGSLNPSTDPKDEEETS